MKTLVKFLFFVACIGLVVACSKSDEVIEEMSDADLKSAKSETVTVGFNAVFTGEYMDGTGPNLMCGECDPSQGYCWGLVINEGKGTGTHLGKFTHKFEFCCNFMTGEYPGPSEYVEGCFIAENGDMMFVTVAGRVLTGRLPGLPSYAIEYFRDPFEITGGTGCFEGATGYGITNDYNSSKDPYSHHHWKGKITMMKSKK